jgi:hypothetical protein
VRYLGTNDAPTNASTHPFLTRRRRHRFEFKLFQPGCRRPRFLVFVNAKAGCRVPVFNQTNCKLKMSRNIKLCGHRRFDVHDLQMSQTSSDLGDRKGELTCKHNFSCTGNCIQSQPLDFRHHRQELLDEVSIRLFPD